MIRDLSLSLRNLLTRGGGQFAELAAAQVAFERPTEAFSPAQATLSLYLYDVRENTELRGSEPERQVVGGQTTLRKAPLRVACTYVITAWPGNVTGDESALREHRLLSQALMVLCRYPRIPAEFLVGSLAGQDPALPLVSAQADGLRNPSEFWTALNNRLRPSLNLSVTLSMQAADAVIAPPAISSEIILRQDGKTVTDRYRIGGRVTDATDALVAGAAITVVGLGLATTSGPDGRYTIGPLAAGRYTLCLQADGVGSEFAIRVPSPAQTGYDLRTERRPRP